MKTIRQLALLITLSLLAAVPLRAQVPGFKFGTNANGGFAIENTSTGGLTITSVKVTLPASTFFDSTDNAPGIDSIPFSVGINGGVASVILPSDSATDGQRAATVSFTGFNPGDYVRIACDYDLYSSPDVDGAPLGARIAVVFSSGHVGNYLVVTTAATVAGTSWAYSAIPLPTPGTLDTSFSGDGIQTSSFSSTVSAIGESVALAPDGTIYVAGEFQNSPSSFAIASYTPSGAYNTAFSDNSVHTVRYGSGDNIAHGVVVDPATNDVIVAGNYASTSNGLDFLVARLTSAGDLIDSFSTDGIAGEDFFGLDDYGQAVALTSGGHIVIAGFTDIGAGNIDFAINKTHKDTGEPYPSFGTAGETNFGFTAGQDDKARAMVIQSSNQYIVTAGYTFNGAKNVFAIARTDSLGVRDSAFAGDGRATADFTGSTDAQAQAVTVDSSGRILVAGFANIGGVNQFAVARLFSNGSNDTSFGSGGRVLTQVAGNSYAYGVAVQSDGKILVGGYASNGTNWDMAIVRYRSNGTLDPTFGPNGTGKVLIPIGSGDEKAYAMALQPDGQIVLAGFTDVGVKNDIAVVRVNGGTVPPVASFTATPNSVTPTQTVNFNASGSSHPDTEHSIVSYAWNWGDGTANGSGVSPTHSYAHFGTYTVVLTVTDDEGGVATTTRAVTVNGAPTANAGGPYSILAGQSLSLNGSGSTDADVAHGDTLTYSWDLDNDGNFGDATGVAPVVTWPTLQGFGISSSGSYTVGLRVTDSLGLTSTATTSLTTAPFPAAAFPTAGSVPSTSNGFTATGLTLGTVTLGFAPVPGTALKLVNNTSGSPIAGTFSDLPNGGTVTLNYNGTDYVFIAGYYGGDGNDLVLQWPVAGEVEASFPADVWAWTPYIWDGVHAIAVQPDGKIVLGGSFDSVLGVARRNIARLNADGTLDTGFDPNATGPVNSVAVQADGKVLLGGGFTTVQPNGAASPTARQYVARLNADGTLDTGFDPRANNSVACVAVQADGKVLLGGSFTTLQPNGAASPTARQYIARVNADGTLDTDFDPKANNSVASVAVQADGKVLLGGYFTTLQPNGAASTTPRQYIARVNADGTLDTGFDPKANSDVDCVAVQADGNVLLGGHFTTLQPNGAASPTARQYIARVNADGTLDTAFDPKANNWVTGVAMQADGKVLLGGWFTTLQPNGAASPTPRQFIARVNADGTLDTAFDPRANGYLHSVTIQADGKVLLGGYFTTLQPNGAAVATARSGLVRLFNDATTQVISVADATQVQWQRGGAAPELVRTTFEISTDGGSSWTPLGAGARMGATSDWQLTGLSLPGSGLIRARGVTTGGYANGSAGLIEQVAPFTDITTLAPTLTAPATNAVTGSPIAVNFTLPEAAQAGSVKLSFGATELTLATSQESAGAHSFTFNPANPTASPEIASGSAIADGTYTVTLSYQDALGNPAATATSTSVTLDTTPPTLSPVTIASNNANPAWAKLGDTVTVSFTASEPIQTPSVTLLGAAATVANPSGNTWTATATVGAGTVEGTAAFSVSATDAVGNAATAVTATTDASLVKVDKTAPTLTPPANILVGATSAAGAAVSFAPGASDNLDPSPVLVANPASGSTFLIGVTTVNLSLTDAAGNSSMGSFTVTVENRTNAPNFANAGTVPLTTDGFNATGLSVGAVALGFNPAPGQVLTLVDNTSANPIGGAFTDLPDGGTVQTTYGGRTLLFLASYLGGDGNDITLTLLNPEIVVEQPATSDVPDGGSRVMPTVVVGTASSLTFTIKNTGPGILNGLTITKDGANEALFTVTASPVAPVNGPTGSTTFTVEFSSATSGLKTAVLHIANDDADENPFDITLTAQALSPADDTDGDGLNDAAEFTLVGLGFDWQVSQPALVSAFLANNALFTQPQYNANYTTGFNAGRTTGQNDVTSDPNAYSLWSQTQYDGNRVAGRNDVINDPNAYSLYTLSQVQSLNVGVPLLTKNPMTGMFKLTIGVRKSTNLVTVPFTAFPMNGPGATTVINGAGKLEFEFPAPGNAAFFRLESQ